MSFLSKWEWFKFKVKQVAITISKLKKQLDITSDINKLCCKAELSLAEHIKLNNLQSNLDNLYLEKAKGAFICSRARWIEEGEKNSFYFFSLEKQGQTKKKINKLLINCVTIENQDQINEEIRVFL